MGNYKIKVKVKFVECDEAEQNSPIKNDDGSFEMSIGYMNDPHYRKQCSTRVGAESSVNEVANSHGARRSRHRTEGRSRLQLIFASIGCNVKR
jgi:hypothetical protein